MATNGVKVPAPDLQEIHDFLIDLATRAGEVITGAKPLVHGVDSKKNSSDLVTEYDRAIEAMVSKELRARYPTFEFMGEETYHPSSPLTDAPTFIVDPIDGTVNFVHGFPNSCISLGLAIRKRPVVGVVLNPATNTLYSAIAGRGAFLNRTTRLPLKGPALEPLRGLSNALISVEWGSDRAGRNWETKLRTFERLGKSREAGGAMVHSMRCLGSAALNMCAVAAGVLDLYWEGGCWAWDVCAGWVIVTEAGGMVVDGNPGGWEGAVDGRKYLAVRASPGGEGQREIIEELWGHMVGTFDYSE
ncbi:myo-inositol-1(or 4)-monophosphatase [Blastomyces gilchristii SLH14081]|uniref:Inositol-1-monophosphatase n=1 Tax=Blastomyces gilchristii (strain SLH14081) TaxID=559298 RepID=A0A179V1A5_BLAGS|nr:myo-inositol-1(or 4)-monophosphatase [Blastomyces gilchristii SLH14081]OAT14095.1 myo-inositol-1(or 4)-monophosphatase [Blastomyces gilchristii SLH14081]